ncbi:hypothetical protein pclt_cds_972 [Pandoravirus celtis]|uniref:BTB domain-containing protein n=1 Tax=Pandoravirus celtis TaxID=2568002 RepID=A0A4D6EJ78_9VIRU|nr:hypothetical protein pclt_cds_972 [Pandoravirus celtis]
MADRPDSDDQRRTKARDDSWLYTDGGRVFDSSVVGDLIEPARRVLVHMRHRCCDCVVEMQDPRKEGVARVVAHRAILARAGYFDALFRRAEPDRVERRDPLDDALVWRVVYKIDVACNPTSLAFLVECLYDVGHVKCVGDCDDPVDVVGAACFLQAPTEHTHRVLRRVLRMLLDDLADPDAAEPRRPLAHFVRHVLASGLDATAKTCLLGRVLGLLYPSDRKAIIADHPDLVPKDYYRPYTEPGREKRVTPDGRHWRLVRVATDETTRDGVTVVRNDLAFKLGLHAWGGYSHAKVALSCMTAIEVLAPAPRRLRTLRASVHPRAAFIDARVYDPSGPASLHEFQCDRAADDKDIWTRGAARDKQTARYEDLMGPVPKNCRLVPDPLFNVLSSTDAQQFAPIKEAPALIFGDDLLACEVDVWVEVAGDNTDWDKEAPAAGPCVGQRPRFLSL